MKLSKLSSIVALGAIATTIMCGCGDDNVWEKYEAWRKVNEEFNTRMKNLRDENGNLFYTELNPAWNPNSGVLIHYFNDRSLTEGNLSPMITSTVSVKYYLSLCDGTPMDSSYTLTDSIFTTRLNEVVGGWGIALTDMRVGDSAQVVIPYLEGYGVSGSGSILPFTTLVFNIKLVDIPAYEIP